MKSMKNMDPDQRKTFGQTSNKVKQELSKAVEDKKEVLEHQAIIDKINSETIDLSLPSYKLDQGTMHPLSIIVSQLEELFLGMGYQIAEGPEVESDYFNFELMNLPKGHPARDMQDTFYIDENTLMRTHTSPVQAHTLLAAKGKGPIKVICPGKTYRRDDDDATHSHQFMQCEGLVIDKNITLADLKGTLEVFARKFFGEKREIRLLISHLLNHQ
jgi:phenylalanyl-tRNA synthetase alpha chain